MFKSPAVVEEKIKERSAQYTEKVGDQIIYVRQIGQQPQDGEVGQYGSAAGDMILQHTLEILPRTFFSPVVPGPEIVQHVVAQNRYLDG